MTYALRQAQDGTLKVVQGKRVVFTLLGEWKYNEVVEMLEKLNHGSV